MGMLAMVIIESSKDEVVNTFFFSTSSALDFAFILASLIAQTINITIIMRSLLERVEGALGWWFVSIHGHDTRLFIKSPVLTKKPEPTIALANPSRIKIYSKVLWKIVYLL